MSKAKKTKPVMEFVIDRSKWRRTLETGSPVENALVNQDKTQCCLGFFVRACGVKAKDAVSASAGWPSYVKHLATKHLDVYGEVVAFEEEFGSLNDNTEGLHGKDLEKAIASKFLVCGAKVTFTGKSPKNPAWIYKKDEVPVGD